jgi:hypothetical protein
MVEISLEQRPCYSVPGYVDQPMEVLTTIKVISNLCNKSSPHPPAAVGSFHPVFSEGARGTTVYRRTIPQDSVLLEPGSRFLFRARHVHALVWRCLFPRPAESR